MQFSRRGFLKLSVSVGAAVISAVFALSLVGCSPAPAPAAADSGAASGSAATPTLTTLYVGTQNDWPPFNYVGEDGKLTGLDADFTNELSRRLEPEGYVLEVQPVGWDSALVGLEAGRIDMVIDYVSITEPRKKTYQFTVPYFSGTNDIFVRSDNTDINSLEDLIGKKIEQNPTDANGEAILAFNDSHPADQQIDVTWSESADTQKLIDLDQGKTDALLLAGVMGRANVKELGLNVKTVGEPVLYREIAVLLQKNEYGDKLKAIIDPIIESMRADGWLKQNSVKWTEQDFTPVK